MEWKETDLVVEGADDGGEEAVADLGVSPGDGHVEGL